MKKTILLYLGAAILMVGCAKVENDEIVPEKSKRTVTLKAIANEPETRVSVNIDRNKGVFSWQEYDAIIVTTEYGGTELCVTNDSGPEANFEVELYDGEGLGQYAFYPAEEGCGVNGDYVYFTVCEWYSYMVDVIPMLGTITSSTISSGVTSFQASFKAIGGLLELDIDGVPTEASLLRFTVDGMQIAGTFVFPVTQKQINVGPIVDPDDWRAHDYIDIYLPEEIPTQPMPFYIPLPCGDYESFKIEIYDEDHTRLFMKEASIPNGLTIGRNQIIVAPQLTVSQ